MEKLATNYQFLDKQQVKPSKYLGECFIQM